MTCGYNTLNAVAAFNIHPSGHNGTGQQNDKLQTNLFSLRFCRQFGMVFSVHQYGELSCVSRRTEW
jgi:hypothetical protein